MGEAAADRAAVADRDVPDVGSAVGEQRQPLAHAASRSARWRVIAPSTRRPSSADVRQLRDRVEVDEAVGRASRKFEQRHQALAAGQHLGVAAVRQSGERLVDVAGAWYSKGAGFLRGPPAVDGDDRPADVGGAVRREERRDFRDFLRLVRPSADFAPM